MVERKTCLLKHKFVSASSQVACEDYLVRVKRLSRDAGFSDADAFRGLVS